VEIPVIFVELVEVVEDLVTLKDMALVCTQIGERVALHIVPLEELLAA
jgi:hypothetical protein